VDAAIFAPAGSSPDDSKVKQLNPSIVLNCHLAKGATT
jgi:hypothetical protein